MILFHYYISCNHLECMARFKSLFKAWSMMTSVPHSYHHFLAARLKSSFKDNSSYYYCKIVPNVTNVCLLLYFTIEFFSSPPPSFLSFCHYFLFINFLSTYLSFTFLSYFMFSFLLFSFLVLFFSLSFLLFASFIAFCLSLAKLSKIQP